MLGQLSVSVNQSIMLSSVGYHDLPRISNPSRFQRICK